jgi:hemerythrin-like metal-binding protein
MNFIWDSKYSVNIKSVDTQHQRFFEIINEIYALVHKVYFTKEELLTVAQELQKYAEFHLSYEEKYFKEYGYPEAPAHIAAHDQFRQQIKEYLSSLKKTDVDISALATEIADFTKNWLSAHILDLDHQYIRFFILHDIK